MAMLRQFFFERTEGGHNTYRKAEDDNREKGIISQNAGSADILEAPAENEGMDSPGGIHDGFFVSHKLHGDILSLLWLSGSGILLSYMVLGMILTGRRRHM